MRVHCKPIFTLSLLIALLSFLSMSKLHAQISGDYHSIASGAWNVNTTWAKYNGSTWVNCAALDVPTSSTASVTIQTGHVVTVPGTGTRTVKDLTVESGATLYANAGGYFNTLRYITVWGNIVCNGTLGNNASPIADFLSLNIEGPTCSISGTGTFAPARLRKGTSTNTTTSITLDMDATLTYNYFNPTAGSIGSGTGLYNNSTPTLFNLTQNTGRTLRVMGSLSIVGIDGSVAGNRGGSFVFNGTVVVDSITFMTSSNTSLSYPTSLTIGSSGNLSTGKAYAGASGIGRFSFTNNGIFNITGTNGSTITFNNVVYKINGGFHNYSTVNNTYTFGAGSTIKYTGAGIQQVEKSFAYKNLYLGGSGAKNVSSAVCTGSMFGGTLNVTALTTGTLAVGQSIQGTNIPDGTTITAFGSGSGGAGTYIVSSTATVSSTTITSFSTALSLTVAENLDIVGSATFNPGISNTLNIGGNWTSYGTAGFTEGNVNGNTQVMFNGSGSQTLSCAGGEDFYNITLNNSGSGLTMSSAINVADTLSLTAGALDLNSSTLSITNPSTTAIQLGTGYIKSENTSNLGKLAWTINSVVGTYTFPFGKTASDLIPLTFLLNSGNAGIITASTYGTPSTNLPWPAAPSSVTNLTINTVAQCSTQTVDRFWSIETTGTPNSDLTFSYAADEVPPAPYNSTSLMKAYRYNAGTNLWEAPLATPTATAYSVSVPGLTNFGTWAMAFVDVPLPLLINSLEASCESDAVRLTWQTGTEMEGDVFVLERSANAMQFETLTTIRSLGSSDQYRRYSYLDKTGQDKHYYYRVKQVDTKGAKEYSKTVVSACAPSTTSLGVYPNPAIESIRVNYEHVSTGTRNVRIFSSQGNLIWSTAITADDSNGHLDIPVANFPSGHYLLQVIEADGGYKTSEFLKIN